MNGSPYPVTIGRIPVRNLWLLMLYASSMYQELTTSRRFAAEENPDFRNLAPRAQMSPKPYIWARLVTRL